MRGQLSFHLLYEAAGVPEPSMTRILLLVSVALTAVWKVLSHPERPHTRRSVALPSSSGPQEGREKGLFVPSYRSAQSADAVATLSLIFFIMNEPDLSLT